MTAARSWREELALAGTFGVGANVLAYIVREIFFHSLYGSHSDLLVVCAEAGFLFSVAVIVALLIGKYRKPTMPLIIGSLVMLYLWFSSIAWWVMAK